MHPGQEGGELSTNREKKQNKIHWAIAVLCREEFPKEAPVPERDGLILREGRSVNTAETCTGESVPREQRVNAPQACTRAATINKAWFSF